ncbi:translation initiation factor IF-2 N-terminal domain-containing protein [Streptomyces coelicoflavus]|uniref:translation initiation factor IF-2 N-terminal domain-containing protein n=1 Tax=Streptomyces coelicoflavus TaxID=285562 RepID=UPI0036A4AA13
MARVRVYELAKEFGVESKVVMARLEELGVSVRSASSTITAPDVRKLTDVLQREYENWLPVDALARQLELPVSELLSELALSEGRPHKATDRLAPELAQQLRHRFDKRRPAPPTSPTDRPRLTSAEVLPATRRPVPPRPSQSVRPVATPQPPFETPAWDPTARWKRLRSFDPREVGPYTILRRIGSGAMGRVFLGQSVAGRRVAVKVIKEELADDREFRRRFEREVAAARGINGFYAPPVVDADTKTDLPWLATAYVSAPSLQELVDACGPLSLAALRWITAQMIEALQSIHSSGIIHRDLKPSNVLVGIDGLRVIDFGLAQAAVTASNLTVASTSLGTPAFMPPEQAEDPRSVTPASDVYALGAVLLFAATRHTPYPGSDPVHTLLRVMSMKPDLTGVPAELVDIVSGCLRRDPELRPGLGELLARISRDMQPGSDGLYRVSELLPEEAFNFLRMQDV